MNHNDSPPVQIKAGRDGFSLLPDPAVPFSSIMAYVEQRLTESQDFFRHSEMVLDLRACPLGSDEIVALHTLLVERAGVKLTQIRLSEELSFSLEHRSPDRSASLPRNASRAERQPAAPVIVRSTCRSGARVLSPSDCVVLGDVNPGAEVIAIGDIVIFGNLRGLAHAGAAGDRSAKIWALSIEPNQLRIADLAATVPPRGNKPAPKRFEIAEVKQDLIEVITI
ncbi:MAG: septum site-determining protein MinC [Syntrophobacteraceae bacterium]